MAKVGEFKVITASGKTIEQIIEVNEGDCYQRSEHPHHMISVALKKLMISQEKAGDPVFSITQRHFWTDDTIGDDDYKGSC